ncbi:DUF1415 domain-containing protein [Chitinophaga niabensis]|uniref:DUF1415 domain-containing protein n=1 Tax=Chitinophaga niabensis TaxID=536979 RepID=A0A1N6D5Q1_9BACT|nr:DUF1415 domain-containing protein [Chitinophaga niabensis]SIN66037.1 hypothetical protein SAMN04488055_0303 [Chitinophaga niabensis]
MVEIIAQTKDWIKKVVVGCNFCPFAAKELKQDTIHYEVVTTTGIRAARLAFLAECVRLDNDESIATTMVIFPEAFPVFLDYLNLVDAVEKMLQQEGYEGIYQVASFHPLYQFAGTEPEDAANYTNRSVYPMLHILREAQIEMALLNFPDPESIPERNVKFAHEKGRVYMKMLRDSCL